MGDDHVLIELVTAPKESKAVVWELYQEYAQELSEYDGEKRRRGHYHYPYFDLYWEDPRRMPYLVLYDHEPVGFCLLQDIGVAYRIDEFYIRPLHRRRGFGRAVVERIKEVCRHLGKHDTLCANVYVNNDPAVSFWKSVGFRDTGRRIRVKDLRLIETETQLCSDVQG